MRLFLVLIFSILFYSATAQLTVYITDAETRLPLPFATAECIQHHWGIYSDSTGKLLVPGSVGKSCRIHFSYVGYVSQEVQLLSSTNIIHLKKSASHLADVIVSGCRNSKSKRLQHRDRKVAAFLGYSNLSSIKAGGVLWANHIENTYKKPGLIKSISFRVKEFFQGAIKEAPVRIHFYEWDSIAMMPGKEITVELIEIRPDKFGWITTDITAFRIHMPVDGVVVGFEMFDAGPQYHYTTMERFKDDTIKQVFHYGWDLEAVRTNENGYRKIPGGKWTRSSKQVGSYALAPAVILTVDVCFAKK